jgi:hypothetical protein
MAAKIEIVLESLFRISMPDSQLGKLRTWENSRFQATNGSKGGELTS